MNLFGIPLQRLHQQRLIQTELTTPAEVVAWLGAVQAQDFMGAKWAIAQRVQSGNHAMIEEAFNHGEILRTHLLRPTWHFVTPADIRWMLKLTAPRIHALSAPYYRQVGLDEATLARSHAVIRQALQGGKHLAREALAVPLQEAGIPIKGELRYPYLLMHAELEGLICSGARQGNHHTYALLEERVASVPALTREESLAALTLRYFTTRGPVTIKDYVRWSGLTVTDAKAGIEMVKSRLQHEVIQGQGYWWSAEASPIERNTPVVHWLPNYDEYLYGYTDGFSSIEGQALEAAFDRNFTNGIVLNGKIVGVWRKTVKSRSVTLETRMVATLTSVEEEAVVAAAHRFGEFLGLTVVFA
jgi:hypothetical protein